ncbi:MAG: 23S rRNA (guanosine(2251)-2'-O)-methyltransferase RlmB [Eubacteriales bacterium]|nr:23S rRNA (guanosine(2251)-2'-O)-methyltransferase RlmB [Eubacteriales bacterium]
MDYKRNDRNRDREGAVTGFKDGQPVYRQQGGRGGAKRAGGEQPYRGGYRNQSEDKPAYGKGERGGYRNQSEDKPAYGKNERGGERSYRGREARPYNRDAQGERPYGGKRPYRQEEQRAADSVQTRRGYPKRNERENEERREPEAVQPPVMQTLREDELPYILMGRNAVKEAVKSGRSIDRILVQAEPDGSLREIVGLARDRNVQIREVDRTKLDQMCMPFGHGGKTGNHQGIVAQVPGVQYCEIADILAVAAERGEKPFIVILDGIEDPYNLGSILRSAECAGAHGVIIPKRRAAGVTSSACKASAGAVEYIKVAQVSNLTGAIGRLKDAGLWIVGADMRGEPMHKVDLSGAVGLVIGSEGKGISKLVRDNCDYLARIPMFGKIDSLNASVAAAILLYEKARRQLD